MFIHMYMKKGLRRPPGCRTKPSMRQHFQLEGGETIRCRDVIGVFDMDQATMSGKTREFLWKAQEKMRLVNVSRGLPQSLVVVSAWMDFDVYISGLSVETICKRMESRIKTDPKGKPSKS